MLADLTVEDLAVLVPCFEVELLALAVSLELEFIFCDAENSDFRLDYLLSLY